MVTSGGRRRKDELKSSFLLSYLFFYNITSPSPTEMSRDHVVLIPVEIQKDSFAEVEVQAECKNEGRTSLTAASVQLTERLFS